MIGGLVKLVIALLFCTPVVSTPAVLADNPVGYVQVAEKKMQWFDMKVADGVYPTQFYALSYDEDMAFGMIQDCEAHGVWHTIIIKDRDHMFRGPDFADELSAKTFVETLHKMILEKGWPI